MTEIEIDAVYPKRSAYPMLVNFQNGYVTDGFRDIECSLYNNDDNSKKTLVSLLDDIVYTGEEEDEPIGRTLLVARDRNTGKVRIIEPGYVELKPVIKNDLNSSQLLETSGLELSRKFGSKKQKKKMEQREKLKMNVETVAKQVEKTTANISVDQLDLSAYNNASVGDDFYIPPINREASCVEDIYSIEKIISNDIMEAIESEIEGKDLSEDIHPSIQSIIDKNPKKTLQTVFGLYASCLAKYYTTVMRDLNCATKPAIINWEHVVVISFKIGREVCSTHAVSSRNATPITS
ncbi:unnamed protein product [Leptosia nina]|uniref:Uncharacterized protein n=1 Tax=Leptosia nina TaxID=320188 RepID=A0AAV1JG27_9NEOP